MRMWPTPTASDIEGGIAKDVQVGEKQGFYRENKKGERHGVKLRDAVNHTETMWPTPQHQDHKHHPEECFEQKGTEEADAIAPYSGTIGDFNPRDNWSVEPNVGRVAHGISDRVDRIKSLGNAVVPQLTYIIGMSIIRALQND